VLKSATSKTASLCQNADDPQNFPKQKDLSRTEQRCVARTAIKVNATDTRLDLFIAK